MAPQPGECPPGRRGRDLSTPHPRAASPLPLPASSRALFHINSSAGCKVREPGEKLFKRDPVDRHLFAAEGKGKGGGVRLLLAAIGSLPSADGNCLHSLAHEEEVQEQKRL